MTTAAAPRAVGIRRLAPDLAVIVVLIVVALFGFEPTFGQYAFLIAGIGGIVVGGGVALGGALARLSVLVTVILAIAGYFLFGSALALPSEAIGGVVPTVDSISNLVFGAVFGWSDSVTLRAPLEAPPYIAVLPYVSTWLVSLVSVSLLCRWLPRRRRTPLRAAITLSPVLVIFVVTILLGTRDAFYAGARGVIFAILALAWIGLRRGESTALNAVQPTRSALRRRLLGAGAVILGAALVGALVGAAVTPPSSNRFVLRQAVTPPFDPLAYPSPLAGFRKYTNTLQKESLFTVAGLKPGSYVRLATMDSYNGIVWSVAGPSEQTSGSGTFQLLGRTIPAPPLFTPDQHETASVTITGYNDVWLPDAGYPATLDFTRHTGADPTETIRVNTVTGTAALTSGVRNGLSYRLGITTQKLPSNKQLATIAPARLTMPPIEDVPDVVVSKGREYAGSANTAIQKLLNIERSLKTFGYLSHGRASDPVPSRAGEGADRMVQLLSATPMVGDQEQYATAFALMAHSLGYPVRVVMGFAVPKGGGAVTGNNVTAWDEVAFTGVGWVPFFPTPTKTDAPKQQTTQPDEKPQPQVRQPPRTNPKDDQLLTPVKTKKEPNNRNNGGFQLPGWAVVLGLVIGIPLILYFVPVGLILWFKRRRRARRRMGPADESAAGAWDELADGYVEMGFSLPSAATRLQVASALESQSAAQGLPVIDGLLRGLALGVDRAVFSAGQLADDAVDGLWRDADAALVNIRAGAGWLRRRLVSLRFVRSRGVSAR